MIHDRRNIDISIGGLIEDARKLAEADRETQPEEHSPDEFRSGRPIRRTRAPIKYQDFEMDFTG